MTCNELASNLVKYHGSPHAARAAVERFVALRSTMQPEALGRWIRQRDNGVESWLVLRIEDKIVAGQLADLLTAIGGDPLALVTRQCSCGVQYYCFARDNEVVKSCGHEWASRISKLLHERLERSRGQQ